MAGKRMNVTRRGFMAGSALTAGLFALAGCDANGGAKKGSGYTETDSGKGYTIVDNGDGKQLSYSPVSGLKLIEKDGYAFKDFEGTGELVPYEDWRLSADERAEDLAGRVTVEQIAGLMCFSAHVKTLENDYSVTDEQKEFLGGNVRAVLNALSGYPAFQQATWANNLQAFVEASDNKIPVNFSSDPRNGLNCTDWPGNLALAATFDPAVAKQTGAGIAKEMREMGVSTFLGPQTDVSTDPRWQRFSGTFGEDPALSRDMCRALVDGLQSTVDENGEDQGWGTGSLVAMVKHWPAEGPGEGGREAHTEGGKYAVYPSDGFEACMIPFVDGAFKLDGKTGSAAAIMTSYTIAYDEDMQYGELVGSGFSKYKVAELLRDKFGFQGSACTDWSVLNDVQPDGKKSYRCWGVEGGDWNPAKRASKAVEVGVDQMGGCNDPSLLMSAYEDMKASLGDEAAEKNFRASAKRLLLGYFNTGIFEDPYVDPDKAKTDIDKGIDEVKAAALDAQVKGIVMLKNHDGVVKKAEGSAKPKAYVPMRFTAASRVAGTMDNAEWKENPATCELPLSKATLEKYFDVVTDKLADTLTGPVNEKTGNATPTEADLTRLAAADIADCDFVLVCAAAPNNASARAGRSEDGTYVPLSVQYRPYTADADVVRKVSLAGDPTDGTCWADHDTAKGVAIENRSYFGQTSEITNEVQLDQILEAAALAKEAGKPCVVILDITQPMCVHEFESEVDAILVSMSGSTEAACRIVAGADEPSGLLPMQMPKDMVAVETQLEDASRDMDCYTDADGNTYDFAYGLNWSGVIDDERVKQYKVAPLTKLS